MRTPGSEERAISFHGGVSWSGAGWHFGIEITGGLIRIRAAGLQPG
jgi:hypothetical protein